MKLLDKINSIIIEYNDLKNKLDNPTLQNWYFKMGMQSNLKRLEYLKKEYSKLYDIVNTGNDLYIQNLIKSYEDELKIEYSPGNLTSKIFHGWHTDGLKNKIELLKEVLEFRKEFTKLNDIDSYLKRVE